MFRSIHSFLARVPPGLARAFDSLSDASDAIAATPARRMVAVVAAGVIVVAAAAMQAGWLGTGFVPVAAVRVAFDVAVVAAVLALWRRIDDALGEMPEPLPVVLWQIACVLAAFAAVAGATDWLLVPDGLDSDDLLIASRWARTLGVAAAGLVTAIAGTLAAAVVLHRLRALAYATPRRAARRTWALMLLVVGVQALTEQPDVVGDDALLREIATGAMVLAILWNAGRQSWIVRLTQGQKWAAIGFSILLMSAAGAATALARPLAGVVSPGLASLLLAVFLYAVFVGVAVFLYALFLLPATDAYQRQADERRALRSLADLMGDAFDRERLTAAIAHAPVAAGLADRAWLVLGSGADVAAAHGLALADAQARTTPLLLKTSRWHGPTAAQTVLTLPLVAHGQDLGALVAERTRDSFFTRDDAESLGLFATQAALAFDHARLFEQTVEKEGLRREMDIARGVQQRLLPATLPTLPGLSIAATSVPALDVGGDYYDVVRAGENRLAVVVADVSGKGTSAAFYMAEMQGAVRALAPDARDPVAFLGDANRVLASVLDAGTFVTALFGVLHVRVGDGEWEVGEGAAPVVTFTSARAGHCPLAVVPADPALPVRMVRSAGLGLGLDRRGAIFARMTAADTTTLAVGDALVLVTDGVIESRCPAGDEYGYDRLAAALAAARARGATADAPTLRDALLADLAAFLDGEPYADDMTLLTMCWHGLPTAAPDAEMGACTSAKSVPERALSAAP